MPTAYIYNTPLWKVRRLSGGRYQGETPLEPFVQTWIVNDLDLARSTIAKRTVELIVTQLEDLSRQEINRSTTPPYVYDEEMWSVETYGDKFLGTTPLSPDITVIADDPEDARNQIVSRVTKFLLGELAASIPHM